MSTSTDRPIRIEVFVPPNSPTLLVGLQLWQELGLLSEQEIKHIAQQLVCPVPSPVAIAHTPTPTPDFLVADQRTTRSTDSASPSLIKPSIIEQLPALLSQRLQALRAEISVIWLLVLGVFLVVVSSAVLAASQWQQFPFVGQYLVLYGYTLLFWLASRWTARQPNLHLTTRTLQATTLLLIPINIWLMDEILLEQAGMGWAIALIAAASLCAIVVSLVSAIVPSGRRLRVIQTTAIALSGLQLGWQGGGVIPLIAVYGGALGTTVALLYQARSAPQVIAEADVAPPELPLATPILLLSSLLLVIRAVWLAQIPFNQVGLAIGLCGWVLLWLARPFAPMPLWSRGGIGLMGMGWLATILAVPPWQAIGLSGLGLWLLVDRLRRFYRIADLTGLILLGLQTYWLVGQLIPSPIRQRLIERVATIAGTPFLDLSLLGITGFPCVILLLGVGQRLRRQQQTALASHSDRWALSLGMGLTALSCLNPLMRSLNLALSALTLLGVVRGKSDRRLMYLTQTVGLLAIVTGIQWAYPNLSATTWAAILLIGMGIEWSLVWRGDRFSEQLRPDTYERWQQSAWHMGLILAAASYVILLFAATDTTPIQVGWLWLVTPLALTFLARPQPRLASWISLIALLLGQLLTFPVASSRLLGLAIGTVVLLVNTRQLQNLLPAMLTVGFGLGLVGAGVWEIWVPLTWGWLVNGAAIALLLLMLLHTRLHQHPAPLAHLYTQATQGWIVLLTYGILLGCTLDLALGAVFGLNPPTAPEISASLLLPIALGYSIWQRIDGIHLYTLAWSLELLVITGVDVGVQRSLQGNALGEGRLTGIAIANLVLAIFSQQSGDWLQRHRPDRWSWHIIPLLYAAMGFALGHREFTATTGLYTLAAAAVGVGVGRRRGRLKGLTIVSLLVGSIAANEGLIYQLLQAEGGQVGDGIVLLAGLNGGIGLLYRCLTWRLGWLHLSLAELKAIAHLHWLFSSSLVVAAAIAPLSSIGNLGWVGATGLLSAYAVVEGRDHARWIYAGIGMAMLAIGYELYRLVPDTDGLLHWAGAIVSLIAVALYTPPWRRWGWSATPWQNVAIVLPIAVLVPTLGIAAIPSLLIGAAFYAWLAQARSRVRLSYISVALADWAIGRWLLESMVREPLSYALVVGVSLLYIVQVDPALQAPVEREKRHQLRCLAIGLICLTALYQSETDLWAIALTLAISIALILAGLSLRLRAPLFIGTLTFVVQILRQLWLLVSLYSLLIWAVGIVLGLLFIWIAATFEARRTQANALVRYWMNELEQWE